VSDLPHSNGKAPAVAVLSPVVCEINRQVAPPFSVL